jgi:hypothetical protein
MVLACFAVSCLQETAATTADGFEDLLCQPELFEWRRCDVARELSWTALLWARAGSGIAGAEAAAACQAVTAIVARVGIGGSKVSSNRVGIMWAVQQSQGRGGCKVLSN